MTLETAHSRLSHFLRGARSSVPVLVAAAPFGILFGALAVDAGLTIGEAVAMSAAIFAGASQMVGLELFGGHIAPWLVVLSIVAVNFRHVLYSASAGRRLWRWPPLKKAAGFFFLTDPQYAETERQAEFGEEVTFAWYMGMALPIYALWVVEAWVGALFGNLITDPHALGLDFLLPIYFLGLVIGFRRRSFWLPVVAASAAGSIVSYEVIGSPWHVSAGAAVGILVAVLFSPAARKVE